MSFLHNIVHVVVENNDVWFLCNKLRELNAEWDLYGNALHVKHATIEAIKQNPNRPNVKTKMRAVLQLWKASRGEKTYRVVYNSVKQLGNYALAEKVKKKGLDNKG